MDTHAVINLEAIRSNCRKLSNFAGQPVLAPIKAGAYGHGAKAVGLALEADPNTNCMGFAVATAFEVFELRHAGIALPVVLLTPLDSSQLARLITEDSGFVVSSIDEVQSLQSEAHVRNKPPGHARRNQENQGNRNQPLERSARNAKAVQKLRHDANSLARDR
jgi:alanine racemase